MALDYVTGIMCAILDTQEPIIDEETWQKAHQIRTSGRRSRQDREKGPLNGYLYCKDCGTKLYFHYAPKLTRPGFYTCGRYQIYIANTISMYAKAAAEAPVDRMSSTLKPIAKDTVVTGIYKDDDSKYSIVCHSLTAAL